MKKPNEQMQQILDAQAQMGPLPIESLTPENARNIPLLDRAAFAVYGHNFLKKAIVPMPMPVGSVDHKKLAHIGSEVLMRIYTPKGEAPAGGWPAVVYFHGGGWVIANLDTYDSSCRALCNGAKAVIISAHYRQAPEHKWPAATEDAFAAYEWVLNNAAPLQINSAKIAVAGESAGGNLATVVALMARDKKIPMPIHQLLVYPVTNLKDGFDNKSAFENKMAKPLNQEMLSWFYDYYIPQDVDREDPYISPLFAELGQMPTTTIILAEIDPLRDDGIQYAEKLREAGVQVNLRIYEGVTHEFFGLAGLVHEATSAVKFATDELKASFKHEVRLAA